MSDLLSASTDRQRFPMILLALFAAVALILAAVGIYGVISYSIAQRIPEIGIRMALGAEKRRVLQMLMTEGLRLALAGLAIGFAGAFVLGRVLRSFSDLLYGVGARDIVTLGMAALALLMTTLLACYLPALRAARIDPMRALRHE